VLIARLQATLANHRREAGLGCAHPRNFPRKWRLSGKAPREETRGGDLEHRDAHQWRPWRHPRSGTSRSAPAAGSRGVTGIPARRVPEGAAGL